MKLNKLLINNYLIYVFFCFFPIFLYAEQNLPEKILDLKNSIKLGLLNNTDLLLSKTDYDILLEKASEAKAGKYPQLEAYAGYTRAKIDSLYSILPKESGDMLLINNKDDFYHLRLTLQQILFAGTKFSNAQRLANASMRRQVKEYEVIKNKTIFDIKKSFYETLYYRKIIEEYDNIINELKEIKKPEELISKIIEELEFKKLELNKEFEISLLNLKYAIGIELDTVCDIKDDFEIKDINCDFEKFIALAKKFRPELNISETQEEMDLVLIKMYQSEKYPVLSVAGAYEYLSDKLTYIKEDWITNWNVTLNVTLPLFDGGAYFARLRQKNIQYKKAKLNKSKILDRINYEVRSSCLNFRIEEEKYKIIENKMNNFSLKKKNARDSFLKNKISLIDYTKIISEYIEIMKEYIDELKIFSTEIAHLENVIGVEF